MDITYVAEVSAEIITKLVLLAERVLDHWVSGSADLQLTASGQQLVHDIASIINRLLEDAAMFWA